MRESIGITHGVGICSPSISISSVQFPTVLLTNCQCCSPTVPNVTVPIETPRNVRTGEYNATAFQVFWNKVDTSRQAMRGKLVGFQVFG